MNTYFKNSIRILVGTLTLCSIAAQAESQFSLGGGVISTSSPYAGTDSETLFYLSLPMKVKDLVLEVCHLIIN
ncbi:hypothetical protein ACOBV9_16945 [Pseudoalteromonas espejiana]